VQWEFLNGVGITGEYNKLQNEAMENARKKAQEFIDKDCCEEVTIHYNMPQL
jgi:hypothetical protein